MPAAIDRVPVIIDKLLALQKYIIPREKDIISEEDIGNVAQLEVYDVLGQQSVRLKLTENYEIVKTDEPPKHLIRMPLEIFIKLIADEMDFATAYRQGYVQFTGEDYHIHAEKWAIAFGRLRRYLKMVSEEG